MIQRYLIVSLVLLSLTAYFWPGRLPDGADTRLWDPFVASKPILSYLIAATMFAIGCLLPPDEVRQVGRRWPTVLGGTTVQYASMPALAYIFAHVFHLEQEARMGVIMVGCVPGAMASNVLTMVARGNVSYSVSLTTSATLLSPLAVPAMLAWALQAYVRLNPLDVSLKLLTEVVGPVVAGFVLCRRWGWLEARMRHWGPVVANLVILWVIAVVVGLNRDRLGLAGGVLIGALATVNLLGYLAGYGGSMLMRLPHSMRRALTLEVGMQNAGLGTYLALELFPDRPSAAIPPAIYTFGCMLTGAVLARLWATRSVA